MNSMYYKTIFLYSSLQFTGNIEEYFSAHSEKLVAFVLMPRIHNKGNYVRLYQRGKLVSEKKFFLPENMILYYFLWYVYQIYFLLTYFQRDEMITMITFHPVTFFGMVIQRLLRSIRFVYWVADFFPPVKVSLILFEKLKRFYHRRADAACYLSDLINKQMNGGSVVRTATHKTVMWGIRPKHIKRPKAKGIFYAIFVGVIKEGQGLEFVFEFLRENKQFGVKIIGTCENTLYKKYQTIVAAYDIQKQVYFPNRFFSERELDTVSKTCHVGIALYDIDKTSATYYTDPGKIKTYAQLGLPVIMSHVSTVAPYVVKFGSGCVIRIHRVDLQKALIDIKKQYASYVRGVKAFNAFFSYETYYRRSFAFLEVHEKKIR